MEKCNFKNCKKKYNIFMGYCKYCSKKFCSYHYMIDKHECENFDGFISLKKEKLKLSISSQKCINNKIVPI
jgi:predicted nucleic acid binding AN1-type Zn finger protein